MVEKIEKRVAIAVPELAVALTEYLVELPKPLIRKRSDEGG